MLFLKPLVFLLLQVIEGFQRVLDRLVKLDSQDDEDDRVQAGDQDEQGEFKQHMAPGYESAELGLIGLVAHHGTEGA